MRRDSIFYYLFKRAPALLAELVPNPPANAAAYRFESVAVKEPRFEIDGVFLPPDKEPGTVYFVEVQFQKDQRLYERIFAETALYFYRSRERFTDWQVVVIYPARSTEQSELFPHRSLLNGGQLHRIYLDELGDIQELPLWISLMVLTTIDKAQAPEKAKELLSRAQASSDDSRVIIDMIVTIISYRFGQMTRQEVEKMLDITFEETKVYQEVIADATKEGLQQGLEQGLEQGRQEEATNFTIRLLKKRFGELPESIRSSISALPFTTLEELGEALLDFSEIADLQSWLTAHNS